MRDGAISVVDLAGPTRRRTFAVVPDGAAPSTGIRFVPGSRLAVVLGPGEFIALVDTDTAAPFARIEHRPGNERRLSPPRPRRERRRQPARHRAGPGSGDVIQVALWTLPSGRPVGKPLVVDREISDAAAEPRRAAAHRRARERRARGRRGRGVERPHAPPRARAEVRADPVARALQPGRPPVRGRQPLRARRASTRRRRSSPSRACSAPTRAAIIGAAITPDDRTLATGSDDGRRAAVGHPRAARRSARRCRASRAAA